MAPFIRRAQRHDHHVPGPPRDLLVAPGTAIRLRRRVRLDDAHLRHRAGLGVAGKARPSGPRWGARRHGPLFPSSTARKASEDLDTDQVAPIPALSARIRVGPKGAQASDVALLAARAESAGAEAFFVNGERAANGANDPFVVLGAAVASTSRIMLGCVASPVRERLPSILAKTITALDVCSAGRAVACLAVPAQHDLSALDELLEAVVVVRALFEIDHPTFNGEHFSITRAWNEPRADRIHRLPIGVQISLPPVTDPAGTVEAAGFAVALSDVVDFVVSDVGAALALPLSSSVSLIRLVGSDPRSDLGQRAEAALVAGHAGVIVDFPEIPDPPGLEQALTLARSGVDRAGGAKT